MKLRIQYFENKFLSSLQTVVVKRHHHLAKQIINLDDILDAFPSPVLNRKLFISSSQISQQTVHFLPSPVPELQFQVLLSGLILRFSSLHLWHYLTNYLNHRQSKLEKYKSNHTIHYLRSSLRTKTTIQPTFPFPSYLSYFPSFSL